MSRRAPATGRVARRVSGPARSVKSARALPALRPLPVLGTIGSHAFRAGRSLPDSRLVDRLMRGRAWIVLLGALLMGLVALNVSLLKLNAEAGRNAEKVKALRIQHADLRAKVSRLASAERLERAGRDLGLAMSIAGRVRYLSARPGDGLRAARAVRAWDTLPSFAFAPLPTPPPPPTLAQTEAPPAAAGATGPSGVPVAAGAAPDTAAGVPPQTTTPAPGTATTPAQPTTGTTPGTAAPPTQPAAGGEALPDSTG